MKTEWGAAYQQKIGYANKVANVGGEDFIKWISETGLGREPRMIKFAAKVGEMISEDSLGKDKVKSAYVLDPKQANSKINKIMGDKNHAYHSKKHPGHADAVQEVSKLFDQAYPEPSK